MRASAGDWTSHGPDTSHRRDNGNALGERTFTAIAEDRFTLAAPDCGVAFEASRVRRERGSLLADLTVTCDLAGVTTFDGVLSNGSIYLDNPKARQERARLLAERARTDKLDFHALLEELSLRVIAAERRGQPAVMLRDIQPSAPDDTFDVEGFPLLKRHPLILFGGGGTGKSMLLLWLLGHMGLRGVRTALFDWELDGGDHRARLELMFGAAMPSVFYIRCHRPLVYEVERLRRICQDEGIQYGGFDSVGFACPGPPESAEIALGYMQAVRSLNIGSTHIAHINKSDAGDQQPFGSSFWHNSARSTWFVKGAEGSPGDPLTVGLYHRKANLGRRHAALGYSLTFDAGAITIRRTNVADVDALAVALPLWQRVRHLLAGGPMTIAEIAEQLEARPNSVTQAVNRSRVFTKLINLPDGIHRYALTERRVA